MPVALGFIPIQLLVPKVKNRCSVIAPTNQATLIDCAGSEVRVLITPASEGFIEAMNRTDVLFENPEITTPNALPSVRSPVSEGAEGQRDQWQQAIDVPAHP